MQVASQGIFANNSRNSTELKQAADAMKNPQLIAEAKKARLDLDPLSGEELEKVVARTYALEKPIVDKLKQILK